eukprot:EG_transcript_19833
MDPGCPQCRALRLALQEKAADIDRLEADFAEFRAVSHDLEAELQADLQRLEARDRTLQLELNQLAAENALLQGRLRRLNEEATRHALALQDATAKHQKAEVRWHAAKRSLEQAVDDLQRKERELTVLAANLRDELEAQQEEALFLQDALETCRAQAQAEQHVAQRLREQLRDGPAVLAVNGNGGLSVGRGCGQPADESSSSCGCPAPGTPWPQATPCVTGCDSLQAAEGLLQALQSVVDRSDRFSTHLARAYAECSALLGTPATQLKRCSPG